MPTPEQTLMDPTSHATPVEPVLPVDPGMEGVTPPAETITIAGKSFTDQNEALAFARQQLAAGDETNAYQQGVIDAHNSVTPAPSVTDPVTPEPAFDEAAFYENPQAALQSVEERAKQSAIDTMRAETAQQKKNDAVWNGFYAKYPKLAKQKGLVESTLNENWNVLGNMPDGTKALDIVAQKTMLKINNMITEFAPGKVMPDGEQNISTGGQDPVTPQIVEDEVVDFMGQIGSNYKL